MRVAIVVSLVGFVGACAAGGAGGPARGGGSAVSASGSGAGGGGQRSLHDRLGGKAAITVVVEDFLGRVSRDDRINARFVNTDITRLRGHLIDFVCQATGGPCQYRGRDMHSAHAAMGITEAEFTALVENLKGALDGAKVPAAEQNELLGALAALKKDVVAPPAPPGDKAATARVNERAAALRRAARLLEKAAAARELGNRSFADQLFGAAEQSLGHDPLAGMAAVFREGAPPAVVTAPRAWTGPKAPQPATAGGSEVDEPSRAAPKASLAGTVAVPEASPAEASVVTLEPLAGKRARPRPRQRVIEQRDREFAPRTLVVPVGSTVSFPNFDDIYHNVYSRSESRSFDLGSYPAGQAREVVFDKEGAVRLGCNLHSNMSAYLVVVSAPHYTVSDPRGAFSFRALAPGKYRLKVWSRRRPAPFVQELVIKPGKNSATITVPAGDKPAEPAVDKFGVPLARANHAR